MKRQLRLRSMLQLLCLGCLSCLLVVTMVAMQLLFPRFYRQRTERNLEEAYWTICNQGIRDDGEVNMNVMARLERDNLSILVFEPESGEVSYNSRIAEKYLGRVVDWQREYLTEALAETTQRYLIEASEPDTVTAAGVPVDYGGSLYLGGWVGTRLVAITVPLESVQTTANISIRFMAWICAIMMLATLLIVSLVSRVVTKPLTQMTKAARQIADLDFSQKCIESGSSEQRIMARSINSMSERMQDYIQQLQTDLAEKTRMEEARKALVANLSHDLKTPIGLVAGYAEGLAVGMARTPEQTREYCEIILDETEHMNSMIARMLELSRLESGTVQLQPEELELSVLLEELLDHFALTAQKEQITVRREWESGLTVRADEFALEQVLTNLIQNAMTYLSGERIVRVSARREDQAVRVEVENTAEPIPQEELDRLWDSFYRRERSRTRKGNEAGLGLAVVRSNLDLMGAPYGAQNVEGGILFWLELPLVP